MHVLIDGHHGEQDRLRDMQLVYDVLDSLPPAIGMTKIMPPYVFRYSGVKPEDWGISGFVLIAESHISIHTFPEHGLIHIDIFSCKEFSAEMALAYVQEKFGLRDVSHRALGRGLDNREGPICDLA
ncbi:MAG: S-adenosylmethionine decarboxylase [Chloroflexota bacterium]